MPDIVREDTAASPLHLGTISVYESQDPKDPTTDRLAHLNDVRTFGTISIEGTTPGDDQVDYFSFTGSGVDAVEVTIDFGEPQSNSSMVWIVPTSGVSAVTGKLVAVSYGHDELSEPQIEVLPELVQETLFDFQNGSFSSSADLSNAESGVNRQIDSFWELDGTPVTFEVFGFGLDPANTDASGTALTADELGYSIVIEAYGPSFYDQGNDIFLYTDNRDYAQTHLGRGLLDIYRFDGLREEFILLSRGYDRMTVTYDEAKSPTDTLIDIERVQFDDGFLAFDIYWHPGAVYRLYQAAFDRAPDPEGLGFWIKAMDRNEIELPDVAHAFMSSEEFAFRYGAVETLSDEEYLTLLYQNVFDRKPDTLGFDFWLEQQANGVGRDQILAGFADSLENHANVETEIDAGIFYL